MRRKRLQHSADILCHKFCGWELVNSYRQLVELGSGTLSIDALSGECRFDDNLIQELTIACALQIWLAEDLKTHNISADSLQRASLVANLRLSSIRASDRVTCDFHMDKNQKPISKGGFHQLEIRCRSEVATDEKTYCSEYEDMQEFPFDWP
ncbi:MAG: hypothetical protein RLN85_07560 [Pseudomonadales bacterium]